MLIYLANYTTTSPETHHFITMFFWRWLMLASLCKFTDLFTWHAVWGDHINPLLIYTSSQLEGGVREKAQNRLWMSISGIKRRVYIRPGERPTEHSWPQRQARARQAVPANKWWVESNFQSQCSSYASVSNVITGTWGATFLSFCIVAVRF